LAPPGHELLTTSQAPDFIEISFDRGSNFSINEIELRPRENVYDFWCQYQQIIEIMSVAIFLRTGLGSLRTLLVMPEHLSVAGGEERSGCFGVCVGGNLTHLRFL
jgi:hypothetical protein